MKGESGKEWTMWYIGGMHPFNFNPWYQLAFQTACNSKLVDICLPVVPFLMHIAGIWSNESGGVLCGPRACRGQSLLTTKERRQTGRGRKRYDLPVCACRRYTSKLGSWTSITHRG